MPPILTDRDRGPAPLTDKPRANFMHRSIAAFLPLCCCALLLGAARADEIRLLDGRILVGKVERRGDVYEIMTRDGVVRVQKGEIERHRTDDELRAELLQLQQGLPDSPFARLQLAIQARAYGLEPQMWQHLDAVVGLTATPEQAALHKRLGDFLAQLEPELLPRKLRRADTKVRVRELLGRHRREQNPARNAAILELLAREPNADKDLRTEARFHSDPTCRLLAVEALLRRRTAGNDRFAWRTAILDRDDKVRQGAVSAAIRHGVAAGAVEYLTPGLMHDSAEVRIRTAEAFANLGDAAAIHPLVIAGPNAGKALAAAGDGVRAHVAFLQQQAYIRDFDVEVAASSFIGNPQIGLLQSGTVLDVTVHGVVEQQVRIVRAYRSALRRLAGSDPGERPADWAGWLLRQREAGAAPSTPRRD